MDDLGFKKNENVDHLIRQIIENGMVSLNKLKKEIEEYNEISEIFESLIDTFTNAEE